MALVGALTIAIVVTGLVIVEANTGPFQHRVQPTVVPVELAGTYTVEDGSASSPWCSSQVADQACDPSTEIELAIEGLPSLAGAGYAAFLVDGDRREPLGELEATEEAHELAYTGDVDADTFEHLRLAIVDASGSQPVPLHDQLLPTSGGDAMPMDDAFAVQLGEASGDLALAQIGAVEIAVTADARIEGLPEAGDWRYEAWLVDDDTSRWTPLGELATDADGPQRLDARQERVKLADQDRFLVTLEPPTDARMAEPGGFPVADGTLQAETLLD